MIEIPVHNKNGDKVDSMQIDETKLGGPDIRSALLKQAYVVVHGNQRQASSRTKSRGMVKGSTRKIYRQKGTGNARMGANRTVIRKGGGVAFAKTRESFRRKLSKKMRQLANRNALLAKMVDFEGNVLTEVKVVENLDFKTPRTSEMATMLGALGVNRTCLVALPHTNREAALSARNIAEVDTIRIDQLNVFDLLNHRFLVVDRATLESFIDGSCFPAREEKKEVA
ncbi:MAG: 50S ribosomal protein L4 [Phycisphaerales bacterium]|nr:50S ribosomal protein L4 [Phycisphaerales bacterium]